MEDIELKVVKDLQENDDKPKLQEEPKEEEDMQTPPHKEGGGSGDYQLNTEDALHTGRGL